MKSISNFNNFESWLHKFNNFVCNTKRHKIWNLGLFISLIIYFILTISSYAEWFPGSIRYFSFNTTFGMATRGAASIIVLICCFFCFVAYRKQINRKWICVFLFMIIISFVMIFITQTTYETLYRTIKLYDFMAVYRTSVSLQTNLKMFISFAFDIAFGYCFIFIIPIAIKNYWYYIVLISLFLVIMFYSCCYSFLKEKDYYVYFLRGDWHYQADSIGSIFGNKQQWGVFLAPAFVCAFFNVYLIFKVRIYKWIKIVSCVGMFSFACCYFFCSLVAFCKTAIVADVVFISVIIVGLIVYLFYKKKILYGLLISTIIVGCIFGFILVMVIPTLHQTGLGKKLFDIFNTLIHQGQTGGESRFELLRAIIQNFPGINLMFGIPKGTLDAYTRSLIPEMVNGLHSGIVIYFGRTGITGLVVYMLLFVSLLKKYFSLFKKKPFYVFLFLASLSSSLILNLAELEILIMSSSATVLMYNIVCVVLPMSETKMETLNNEI